MRWFTMISARYWRAGHPPMTDRRLMKPLNGQRGWKTARSFQSSCTKSRCVSLICCSNCSRCRDSNWAVHRRDWDCDDLQGIVRRLCRSPHLHCGGSEAWSDYAPGILSDALAAGLPVLSCMACRPIRFCFNRQFRARSSGESRPTSLAFHQSIIAVS